MSLTALLLFLIVVFVASMLTTFSTFGFTALILVPLSFIMPLPQAIAVSGIIDLANGLIRGGFFRNKIDIKLIILFGVPATFFSLIGSLFVSYISTEVFDFVLGVILICYGVMKLFLKELFLPAIPPILIFGGSISGILAGLFGAGGVFRTLFLSNYSLQVASFIATTTLIENIVDIARVGGYLSSIQLDQYHWNLIIISIIVSFFGVWSVEKQVKKVSTVIFSRIVSIAFICYGVYFILY
jgi:uncharacterized protein